METEIKRWGMKWIATNGWHKVETYSTKNGLPVFRSCVALYELFPHVKSEVCEYLLTNHTTQATVAFPRYGACWFSTTVSSGNGKYPTTNLGGKKWGFYLQDSLHKMSFNILNQADVEEGEIDHICLCPGCINPEHLVDKSKSDHHNGHVARLENIPEHELRTKGNGLRKITNRMAVGLRYLHKCFKIPVAFLAFFCNCSQETIRKVINEETHIITDEDIQREFNEAIGIKTSVWNDLRVDLLIHLNNSGHYGILKKYARALGVKPKTVYNKIANLKKEGKI